MPIFLDGLRRTRNPVFGSWRDHALRCLTEFPQLFVGHLPEPRSQRFNVQGRELD